MAKRHGVLMTIPELYQASYLNAAMFNYVRGVRAAIETVTIKQAIEMFAEDYDLTPDDLNVSSAIVLYVKFNQQLINLKRDGE